MLDRAWIRLSFLCHVSEEHPSEEPFRKSDQTDCKACSDRGLPFPYYILPDMPVGFCPRRIQDLIREFRKLSINDRYIYLHSPPKANEAQTSAKISGLALSRFCTAFLAPAGSLIAGVALNSTTSGIIANRWLRSHATPRRQL